ncbi:MAG TPA: polyprenyl synthetase family protein [Mycobacteriales bacterium]
MTSVAPGTISRSRDLVEPALRAAVDRLSPRPRLAAGYHRGWWEADGTPREGGSGKALRPALAVLSAQAAGGPVEPALPCAVAVELVHDFSLLHDDVMDKDTERRHRPTAWAVFGVPLALLAGDGLLGLAVQVIAESDAPGRDGAQAALLAAVQDLIRGQVDDIDLEGRLDVELADVLRMEADKTSALLACSASIGARALAAPAALCQALHEFGFELGLAFQLVDDVLGIWGEPAVTGKPVLADLRVGKRSAPVVAALRSGTQAGDELAALLAHGTPTDEEDVVRAARLVERAGGRDWTAAAADEHLAAALDALDGVPGLAEPAYRDLVDLARYVIERDR